MAIFKDTIMIKDRPLRSRRAIALILQNLKRE